MLIGWGVSVDDIQLIVRLRRGISLVGYVWSELTAGRGAARDSWMHLAPARVVICQQGLLVDLLPLRMGVSRALLEKLHLLYLLLW